MARIIQIIRTAYYEAISCNISVEGKLIKCQPLLIVGNCNMIINGTAIIGCSPSPFCYNGYAHFDLRNDNAYIEIGNGVHFNNNATLIADGASIFIGGNTIIGLNFTAITSDANGLHPDQRCSPDYPRKDVHIGMNVFVGNNVNVLKGVSIGDNSVIGNGSVIVKDISANVIAAGLPCKVINAF